MGATNPKEAKAGTIRADLLIVSMQMQSMAQMQKIQQHKR